MTDLSNFDWAQIIQAAASSPLGLLALVAILISIISYFLLRGAPYQYRFAAFVLLFIGAVGLTISVFQQKDKKPSQNPIVKTSKPIDKKTDRKNSKLLFPNGVIVGTKDSFKSMTRKLNSKFFIEPLRKKSFSPFLNFAKGQKIGLEVLYRDKSKAETFRLSYCYARSYCSPETYWNFNFMKVGNKLNYTILKSGNYNFELMKGLLKKDYQAVKIVTMENHRKWNIVVFESGTRIKIWTVSP